MNGLKRFGVTFSMTLVTLALASSQYTSRIVASVADETMAVVDRLFPGAPGQEPVGDDEHQALFPLPERSWQPVPVSGNGYIQSVDGAKVDRLLRRERK